MRGCIVSRNECPEVFQEFDALWRQLTKMITEGELNNVAARTQAYAKEHPVPVVDADEVLRDEGEDPGTVDEGMRVFRLKSTASHTTVTPALDTAADQDRRLGSASDFQRLREELQASRYTSISARSFLWLIGWCNTSGAYQKASEAYAQPLALAMFGYVPEHHLRVDDRIVDLKTFRYRSSVYETLEQALLARHSDLLDG